MLSFIVTACLVSTVVAFHTPFPKVTSNHRTLSAKSSLASLSMISTPHGGSLVNSMADAAAQPALISACDYEAELDERELHCRNIDKNISL